MTKFYLTQVNISNTIVKESLLKLNKKKTTIARQKHNQGMINLITFSIVEKSPDIILATSIIS